MPATGSVVSAGERSPRPIGDGRTVPVTKGYYTLARARAPTTLFFFHRARDILPPTASFRCLSLYRLLRSTVCVSVGVRGLARLFDSIAYIF